MGTADTEQSTVVDADTWAEAESAGPAQPGPGRYALGLDLGSGAAMSAAAAYWPRTGELEAFAVFPEIPSLEDREQHDGCPYYRQMAARGELLIAGRRVASIPALLREAVRRWGPPGAIVCDAWREKELRQELEAVNFPHSSLTLRRQGFYDGGEDLRLFQRAMLDGKVRPAESLLMRQSLSESRGARDAIDRACSAVACGPGAAGRC